MRSSAHRVNFVQKLVLFLNNALVFQPLMKLHCISVITLLIRDFFDTPIKQFVRHPRGFNISLVTSNTGLDTATLIRSLQARSRGRGRGGLKPPHKFSDLN